MGYFNPQQHLSVLLVPFIFMGAAVDVRLKKWSFIMFNGSP